jgi:hypothetical protein
VNTRNAAQAYYTALIALRSLPAKPAKAVCEAKKAVDRAEAALLTALGYSPTSSVYTSLIGDYWYVCVLKEGKTRLIKVTGGL